MSLTTVAPFYLATTFTTSPFGGNPAAVIFMDTSVPLEKMGAYAKNFNQPVLTVVSPISLPSDREKTIVRSVRFIAPNGKLIPICGHGLIAASKVVFSLPEVVASGADTVHFINVHEQTLGAFKHDDGSIEIQLPATVPGSVSGEDKAKIKVAVNKAFGRNVVINDIVNGGDIYKPYVMVRLHESEDLAGSSVDAKELLGTGFVVNIFTAVSPTADQLFISRMFAPSILAEPHEDHVCGSAHAILVPYWSSKLAITPGEEFKAKMVSQRSGDLRLTFEKAEGTVKLRGNVVIFASGTFLL